MPRRRGPTSGPRSCSTANSRTNRHDASETTTRPRISLAAASTILRRVDLDAGELTSLHAGGARLSDVAAELEALGNERGRAAAAVLRNLERSPIRLGNGVSDDDAFIDVAATLLASRLSA